MRRLLVAQFSDLHLGASLADGRLGLPAEKVAERAEEQRQCLERFVARVREVRPDMVLMPGDLFDDSEPCVDDLNFLIDAINRMAPTQVYIAPGNDDGYTPSSGYCTHSALYRSRGGPKWGKHVHLFAGQDFETVHMPHHESVTITGVAFHRHLPEDHSRLAGLAAPEGEGMHLLVFHGSLVDYPRAGADKAVLPFTRGELAAAGYNYAAVGHYHRGGPIRNDDGHVLGAYAGAPFAATLAHRGAGTWLEVEIDPTRPVDEGDLHWRRADERAIRRVELNVTGLVDAPAFAARLDELLAARNAQPADLVHVVLRGRMAHGADLAPLGALRKRFYHVAIDDSQVEADYDIRFDAPPPQEPDLTATSEEVFRARMLRLYHKAKTDKERQRIREALLYGLDALTLGEIHLR